VVERDGLDEALEVLRIHLVVGGHDRGDVDPLVDSALVAGHDRRADALVPLVLDHLDALVLERAGSLDGRVLRGVVHDVDAVDECGDRGDGLAEELLLVVRGHDDRHTLAFQHPWRLLGAVYGAVLRIGGSASDPSEATGRHAGASPSGPRSGGGSRAPRGARRPCRG
jgi:hypothetical protein